jgi:hypothetical protein
MKKLRLELDQLTVDSFDTAVPAAKRGTVMGEEQCTCPSACNTNCTCPGCPTCDHTYCNQASCNGTCDDSCASYCHTCAGEYTCDFSLSRDPWACQCCPQ